MSRLLVREFGFSSLTKHLCRAAKSLNFSSPSSFSTYYRPYGSHGNSAYKNHPIEDLLTVEQLKSTLKKHGFLPKKESNGLFHICYCPICNKNRDISTQKLYLYPKYVTYSCNNCTDKGVLNQLWESLKESMIESDASNETSRIDFSKIHASLQPVPSLSSLPATTLPVINQSSNNALDSVKVKAYQSEFGHFISCPLYIQNAVDNELSISGEYFQCLENENYSFFKTCDSELV